jgi:hypothetical protein
LATILGVSVSKLGWKEVEAAMRRKELGIPSEDMGFLPSFNVVIVLKLDFWIGIMDWSFLIWLSNSDRLR